MKLYKSAALFIIIHLSLCQQIFAQTNNISVNITNTENKTTTFSAADLIALPQTTLNVKGEDGAMHNYSGIDINLLLNKSRYIFWKRCKETNVEQLYAYYSSR